MPNLVITLKRKDTSKDWFYANNVDDWTKYFTQQEVDTVFKPHYERISSSPGFLGTEFTFVDDYTLRITYKYDTKENLATGIILRVNYNDEMSAQRREMINNKMTELGIEIYDYSQSIE
jgi:hypothetical protein